MLMFLLSIISKSFTNFYIALNCQLYAKNKKEEMNIEQNERVLNNVLLNSFPMQWITTLNDRNFTNSRTSNNCFLMRFKMHGYEIMRRFFEKPEMRERYHGDKFFSTIEEFINNKVKFFGFEKYNDQCGEYVILCNMEDDENAKIKKNAEEMISLAHDIYTLIRVSNYIVTSGRSAFFGMSSLYNPYTSGAVK